MTITEFKKTFQKGLSPIYNSDESAVIFSIFLKKFLNLDQFQQRINATQNISAEDEKQFNQVLNELKTGRPYQQILGETEFYGLHFFVDEHVLIPRPETEELLEWAIEKMQDSRFEIRDAKNKLKSLKILDIGTGSGNIPIILKKNFPEAEIFAIDFSEKALRTAKKNAAFHQVDINFIHQDYLNENLSEIFDIIISNPPYIGIEEKDEISDTVKNFEPKMALFSPTNNSLIFYEKIAADCKKYLAKNGLVFLEINQKLGLKTLELFTDILCEVHLLKDLSGNDRFVWGRK